MSNIIVLFLSKMEAHKRPQARFLPIYPVEMDSGSLIISADECRVFVRNFEFYRYCCTDDTRPAATDRGKALERQVTRAFKASVEAHEAAEPWNQPRTYAAGPPAY